MPLDYIKLAEYARRDTTLLPNHRNNVLPALKHKIAEIRGMIATLESSRADFKDMIAEFKTDMAKLVEVERFYDTATVKPGARPRFNPNFRAYAKAHGRTPTQQLAQDDTRWPGGCMCGFTLWIGQMKRRFFEKCPQAFLNRDTISDLAGWQKFLHTDAVRLSLA